MNYPSDAPDSFFSLRRLIVVASLVGIGVLMWKNAHIPVITPQELPLEIVSYDHTRDGAEALQIFQDNWYWMIQDSPENYDLEYRLSHSVSHDDPEQGKPLTIMVARRGERVVGLIAYFTKDKKRASILYLITDASVRRQGIAKRLLEYVLLTLTQEGFTSVELATRMDNVRSQALYRSLGFDEFKRNDAIHYIWMQRALPYKR